MEDWDVQCIVPQLPLFYVPAQLLTALRQQRLSQLHHMPIILSQKTLIIIPKKHIIHVFIDKLAESPFYERGTKISSYVS